jgi:anti-repressor protein
MNRDGFSLVVMSFTGTDADEWKLKYIKAFNRMEQIIRNELIAFQQQAAKMPQRGTKEFFAMALLDAQQVIEDQERQLLAAQPAIVFHQAVAVSEDTILVRDFAKLITQALRKNGFPKLTVGEKKLFDWLREKGYLIKQKSNSFNMPTQKSIDMNLFHIKETTIQGDHGSRITKTPKITGKGQEYFIDKILEIYKSGGTIDV